MPPLEWLTQLSSPSLPGSGLRSRVGDILLGHIQFRGTSSCSGRQGSNALKFIGPTRPTTNPNSQGLWDLGWWLGISPRGSSKVRRTKLGFINVYLPACLLGVQQGLYRSSLGFSGPICSSSRIDQRGVTMPVAFFL